MVAKVSTSRTRFQRHTLLIDRCFNTAQSNPEVGAALQVLIAEGTARLAAYLQRRVQAGELRANLPAETGARMFFASLMIFFLTHRLLSAADWQQYVDLFIQELVSVWLDGAHA